VVAPSKSGVPVGYVGGGDAFHMSGNCRVAFNGCF